MTVTPIVTFKEEVVSRH